MIAKPNTSIKHVDDLPSRLHGKLGCKRNVFWAPSCVVLWIYICFVVALVLSSLLHVVIA